MLDFKSLVSSARTARRFAKDYVVPYEVLEELVDMARITPSGGNRQILRYAIINDKETCDKISKTFVLGGNYRQEDKPKEGDEPNAYIAILGPEEMNDVAIMDIGIAAQTMQLGATEKGLGACMIGAFNAPKLKAILIDRGLDFTDPLPLKNPEPTTITLRLRILLALGKPAEFSSIVESKNGEPLKYYTEGEKLFVPKRLLKDIILLKT